MSMDFFMTRTSADTMLSAMLWAAQKAARQFACWLRLGCTALVLNQRRVFDFWNPPHHPSSNNAFAVPLAQNCAIVNVPKVRDICIFLRYDITDAIACCWTARTLRSHVGSVPAIAFHFELLVYELYPLPVRRKHLALLAVALCPFDR